MDRPLLVVAVALLAVTAGCSGFGGQSPTTTADRTTDAKPQSTTTGEPTQTQPAVAAPGFEGERLVQPLALADAHRQVLAGSSFTRRSERTTRDGGETASETTTLRVENESRWFAAQTFDVAGFLNASDGFLQQYAAGDYAYYRFDKGSGNVSYGARLNRWGEEVSAGAPPVMGQRFARDYVYAAFTTASWTTVAGEERSGGNASGDTTFRGEPVSDFEVRANVTGEGFVRDLGVSYEQGGTAVERTISFSGVGDTHVERPEWYDTALNRTEEPEPGA
jgi:hypothetical protein